MNMIAALRQSMINRDIAATVVPSTDPHGSEYVADHWQARSELSGFDGSAGTLFYTGSRPTRRLWHRADERRVTRDTLCRRVATG